MAKKGQKFSKYSDDLKELVVQTYLAGFGSYRELQRRYNVTSWKTIRTWVEKYKKTGIVKNIRNKKPQEHEIDYKTRYEILKNYLAFLNKEHQKK